MGQNGVAAIPTTVLDLHLVQLLPQSRSLMDLGLHGAYIPMANAIGIAIFYYSWQAFYVGQSKNHMEFLCLIAMY